MVRQTGIDEILRSLKNTRLSAVFIPRACVAPIRLASLLRDDVCENEQDDQTSHTLILPNTPVETERSRRATCDGQLLCNRCDADTEPPPEQACAGNSATAALEA